ncbi:calvin cycle protein CP12-1, chloroplastic-like [Chenopodium quinoa]|uniref:CP12 domain-containing protein n=1 Tax=Chenopodium quinoa TaxID=63459 RepID=A0A803LF47_CHEQI|nr:calvin cycle protein CP12-1, chloroplastic-like [Chenopodium quinoa]
MASMSVFMSPKLLLANKPSNNFETPKLCNMVTYIRKSNMHASRLVVVRAAPDKLSDNVEKSIKEAQETCSDDPVSSECVAAWDVVEEVSAAASHARDKAKDSDPLEEFCKDNPETDECKTYDN